MLRQFIRAIILGLRDNVYRPYYLSALGLLITGEVFYRIVEGWSWVDSFYFSVVTLTTVGFADPTPTKTVAKIFTMLYFLGGVSYLLTFLQTVTRRAAEVGRSAPPSPGNDLKHR